MRPRSLGLSCERAGSGGFPGRDGVWNQRAHSRSRETNIAPTTTTLALAVLKEETRIATIVGQALHPLAAARLPDHNADDIAISYTSSTGKRDQAADSGSSLYDRPSIAARSCPKFARR